MKNAAFLLLPIALLAGGAGFVLGQGHIAPSPAVEEISAQANGTAARHTAYVCPMHPHIVQDHPGSCPICGMDLVAVEDADGSAASEIHVDTATQQKLGVQLVAAASAALTHDISTYGTLVPDEGALLRITPNVGGLLTRLNVSHVGQHVARGQILYEVSSQDALNLQYEYVDILRRGEPTLKMAEERRNQNRIKIEKARDLDPSARERIEREVSQSEDQLWSLLQPWERDRERLKLRLQQIGLTDEMLTRLRHEEKAFLAVPVRAPRACVVQNVMGRPGMMVGPTTEILDCVDASHAQIEIVLYPDQLSWVEDGDAVTMTFGDGETVSAPLSGLNPLVDDATRTVRVRMPVTLKRAPNLGEYVKVTLHTKPRQMLAVPKTAVMRTGHGDFVMRAMGKGHFMPVRVQTGIEGADRVGIRHGLADGDQVAVNGQFLMDAAASIADTARRMHGGDQPSN
jgi:Cu(I)/Ag(I) efflux system membrane fusion protein